MAASRVSHKVGAYARRGRSRTTLGNQERYYPQRARAGSRHQVVFAGDFRARLPRLLQPIVKFLARRALIFVRL